MENDPYLRYTKEQVEGISKRDGLPPMEYALAYDWIIMYDLLGEALSELEELKTYYDDNGETYYNDDDGVTLRIRETLEGEPN